MEKKLTTGGADEVAWAPVDVCTLPTAERPARRAEFDELFASLRAVDRAGDTRARLFLAGGAAMAEQARRVADAESSCCSFFTFGVSTDDEGLVALDVEVPSAFAAVLDGLVAQAEAAARTAS